MKQHGLGSFMFAVLAVSASLFARAVPVCASDAFHALPCRVVNLMPAFWRFWDAVKDQPPSVQLSLFDEMVVRKYPEVYQENVLRPGRDESDLKTQIADFLVEAPANIAAMRKLGDSLETGLPLYLSGVQKVFPDFACKNSIYFLVSLGAFDGGVRTVSGQPALLFGVDVTARIHIHRINLAYYSITNCFICTIGKLRASQAPGVTRFTVRCGRKGWRPT
jgi:hypothetical protein